MSIAKLRSIFTLVCLYTLFFLFSCQAPKQDAYKTWQHYLGDQARTHYSSLDQINRETVNNLEVAWEYSSNDHTKSTYIQFNPLIVGDIAYVLTPGMKVVALNAGSGEEVWVYDPGTDYSYGSFTRGLHYWESGNDKRILFAVKDFMMALQAETGEVIESFGENGRVNLAAAEMPAGVEELTYNTSSPGAIYGDLIMLGFATSEKTPAVPGNIRAFNIRTGEVAWKFNLLPQPGEYGYETWPEAAYTYSGGVNSWCGMTLDEERGILYVPTGSAATDFWGGDRAGENLFANCVVALNAKTGERIWHYQTVHHDIWDRDLPAPPTLVTVEKEGRKIDALAQITKSGFVFLLDRETGENLFPVEEKVFPASALYEEEAWPTQPIPAKPEPFSRQRLTVNDINPFSKDRDSLINILASVHSKGPFYPPTEEGTVIFPGFDGGGEWGGAGYDPSSGYLIVNANEMPWILTMVDLREDQQALTLFDQGKTVYQTFCMSCHGADLQGTVFHGNAPSLVNLVERMDTDSIEWLLAHGRNNMPSFNFLETEKVSAVSAFLLGDKQTEALSSDETPSSTTPYGHTGYNRFVDSEGYPAVSPPWGTLNAIDLNKGEIVWKVPLGEHPELTERGIPITGTENYGGPVVTAGGLIFIGATTDSRFRAFDIQTGEEVWSYQLPFACMATPSTYEVDGKQYILVPAGGGKITEEKGDKYIAFALPD